MLAVVALLERKIDLSLCFAFLYPTEVLADPALRLSIQLLFVLPENSIRNLHESLNICKSIIVTLMLVPFGFSVGEFLAVTQICMYSTS